MALRPSLTHPSPGAHAPLGSNDTNRHNDKGEEAAGADACQHHQQGDESLAAEAEAAFAVGSSCRNRARAAKGPSSSKDPRAPQPRWPPGHGVPGPPGQGGSLAGVRVRGQEEAPAAGMSKRDKHIRPRGLPTRRESGWGQGAMSSPSPTTHLWTELARSC